MNNKDLEKYRESKKRTNKAKEALDTLIDLTNSGGQEDVESGMLLALLTNHPTLVQLFVSALNNTMKQSLNYPRFQGQDLRCQATSEYFKKVSEIEQGFPFI